MKLIIQVPCYNEAENLANTLNFLPRQVEGFDEVELLIIDDGSHDNTSEIAKNCGVKYVIKHPKNRGLAKAFMTGINACLAEGADVIVNTDADNQYEARDIVKLTQPILDGKAELVIGARPVQTIEHFSPIKKLLQRLGSWVVRIASNTDIPDAPSGFRAISRSAAQKLVVFSSYTYTLETIIQAGQKDIAITSVPIRVNEDVRPSRLVKSIRSYIQRSIITIIRIFVIYRPFRFFSLIGLILFSLGFALGLRFLYFYINGSGSGHIQSLILSSLLIMMGFQTILIAFIADLLSANRKLLEDLRFDMAEIKQHKSIFVHKESSDKNQHNNQGPY